MDFEKLKAKMEWCEKYIDEFIKNEEFDPLAALTDTETKSQKLYGECVSFIYDICNYVEDRSKIFDDMRYRIIFG